MSRVDELFHQIGQGESGPSREGTPQGTRYRLTKKDLMKALAAMPDGAAIWNTIPGQNETDAKRAIRDALWSSVEKAVKPMVLTPTGEYVEGRP